MQRRAGLTRSHSSKRPTGIRSSRISTDMARNMRWYTVSGPANATPAAKEAHIAALVANFRI
jgi:hypothetical protein